jgi:hypothetical protein
MNGRIIPLRACITASIPASIAQAESARIYCQKQTDNLQRFWKMAWLSKNMDDDDMYQFCFY